MNGSADRRHDNYQYTFGAGATTSYLTGAYANPQTTMNMLYLAATYKL